MTGDNNKTTPAGKEKDAAAQAGSSPAGSDRKSREDRLADALRANLRRRKAAAKERKTGG